MGFYSRLCGGIPTFLTFDIRYQSVDVESLFFFPVLYKTRIKNNDPPHWPRPQLNCYFCLTFTFFVQLVYLNRRTGTRQHPLIAKSEDSSYKPSVPGQLNFSKFSIQSVSVHESPSILICASIYVFENCSVPRVRCCAIHQLTVKVTVVHLCGTTDIYSPL